MRRQLLTLMGFLLALTLLSGCEAVTKVPFGPNWEILDVNLGPTIVDRNVTEDTVWKKNLSP